MGAPNVQVRDLLQRVVDVSEARPSMLGKAGRGRNWKRDSSVSDVHRITDRRAHGTAAGGGGVCEGG